MPLVVPTVCRCSISLVVVNCLGTLEFGSTLQSGCFALLCFGVWVTPFSQTLIICYSCSTTVQYSIRTVCPLMSIIRLFKLNKTWRQKLSLYCMCLYSGTKAAAAATVDVDPSESNLLSSFLPILLYFNVYLFCLSGLFPACLLNVWGRRLCTEMKDASSVLG